MKRRFLISGIVVGAILTLGPVWGMLGTMFGMMRAFSTLQGNGIQDPRQLSGEIGEVLLATTAGLVMCPIGIVLLAVCIVLLVSKPKASPPPIPQTATGGPDLPSRESV